MMSLAVEPVDDIARPCVRENSVMMPSIINGWSSTKPMETTIGLLQMKKRYKKFPPFIRRVLNIARSSDKCKRRYLYTINMSREAGAVAT
jgi:hypothetical protein